MMVTRCALCLTLLLPGAVAAQVRPDSTAPRPDTVRIRLDSVIIASTRTGRRIEDEPVRVEVVGREEIQEKLMMTPGDIAMLLNETGGVRVQTVSPSIGGAAVRIQGLRGRYAQVLADGLPLYGEASGLGPLQIPPIDLAQVEVIKGAASALYGASALGGVINLISRRPDGESESLFNYTSRGGSDLIAYVSSGEDARRRWTILTSRNAQPQKDVNGDGWADLPFYARETVRPRLHLGSERRAVMITGGYMHERRTGGTVGGVPQRAVLRLNTQRLDAGAVGSVWAGQTRIHVRASAMEQQHDHDFDEQSEHDRHRVFFGEVSWSGARAGHTWVLGAAAQHDGYRNDDVTGFDREVSTPGLFIQDEWSPVPQLAMSLSARVDWPEGHGALLSPRLSVLLRPGEWTVRTSAGGGHHVPTHWIEDVEPIGLHMLAGATPLDVERARSVSFDIGRELGIFEINATAFGSIVEDAVALRGSGTATPVVVNVPGRTRTWGGELLTRAHTGDVHATFSYAYVRATEPDPDSNARRAVAMTPRHAAGLVLAWEKEDFARIGFESYYTGRQALHDNPYRAVSKPYVLFGMLAERHFENVRVFINFENIGDVRQTRWDPFLLPARARDGRWTTEAWAPLEGRVINAGVRFGW